jgi:hypothetical protein
MVSQQAPDLFELLASLTDEELDWLIERKLAQLFATT